MILGQGPLRAPFLFLLDFYHGATIYTLDRKFAEAGEDMGAMTKLL
jgi:hypothetical protein